MLQMPIDKVISKISEHSKLSAEEIQNKIKAKLASLSGLVSEEGAAYIIANELGVKLFEEQVANKFIKIKDVLVGMKNVDTIGKIIRIFETRTFIREGKESKVGNFIIADETGNIKIVLWDNKRIEMLENGMLQVGSIVKIKNGYVRENNYSGKSKEIHLGLRGQLVLDEETKIDVEVPKQDDKTGAVAQESKIINVLPGTAYKLRGTVVRAFPPNFYNACKECWKKVQQEGEKSTCKEHGEVTPVISPILNFILDDGTENIRCTAFRDTAENLMGNTGAELQALLQTSSEELQTKVDNTLLGIELEIEGFVRENKQFNRTELTINKVTKPDPIAIAKALLGEVKK